MIVSATPHAHQDHAGIQSVLTALDILDCFADRDELGVSDIARRIGVAKSTAHRLLASLCARGVAEQNPENGRYRLGLHLLELGQLTQRRMRLPSVALPLLEELRQTSGYSVYLSIADGADVVHVVRLGTLPGMHLIAPAASPLPAHCTAAGKALAAHNADLARACRTGGFPPLTPRSLRTTEQFDWALAMTRRTGLATDVDEAVPGVSSLASPVLNSASHAVAAVTLAGPTVEFGRDAGRTSRLVLVTARRLARALGN
jgi:DNA-binding IclR family transcriptional regulator